MNPENIVNQSSGAGAVAKPGEPASPVAAGGEEKMEGSIEYAAIFRTLVLTRRA